MPRRPIEAPEAELMVQTLVGLIREWIADFTRMANAHNDQVDRYQEKERP